MATTAGTFVLEGKNADKNHILIAVYPEAVGHRVDQSASIKFLFKIILLANTVTFGSRFVQTSRSNEKIKNGTPGDSHKMASR